MKMMYLIIAFGLLCWSCNVLTTENVKSFIPGTYITQYTSEFSESRDTLSIAAGEGSINYTVTRRTFFRYLNAQRKPQYKLVHWTASYDLRRQILIVNNNGRILSFNPSKKEMKMGTTTYKKL